MSDREEFETWITPWLWTIPGALLDRLHEGGPYRHPSVQLAWQAFIRGSRGAFVSSSFIDLELP